MVGVLPNAPVPHGTDGGIDGPPGLDHQDGDCGLVVFVFVFLDVVTKLVDFAAESLNFTAGGGFHAFHSLPHTLVKHFDLLPHATHFHMESFRVLADVIHREPVRRSAASWSPLGSCRRRTVVTGHIKNPLSGRRHARRTQVHRCHLEVLFARHFRHVFADRDPRRSWRARGHRRPDTRMASHPHFATPFALTDGRGLFPFFLAMGTTIA